MFACHANDSDSNSDLGVAVNYVNSASPYGTFDQGGNVWEWNETAYSVCCGSYRGLRGGSFGWNVLTLGAYQWPVDNDVRDEFNNAVSAWQVLLSLSQTQFCYSVLER